MSSKLEKRFIYGWGLYGDPNHAAPIPDTTFHPTRMWRWDFQWPDLKIGIDIQGGTNYYGAKARQRGKHSRPEGQRNDMEKLNAATLLGWRVLHFDAYHLALKRLPATIALVNELLAATAIKSLAPPSPNYVSAKPSRSSYPRQPSVVIHKSR